MPLLEVLERAALPCRLYARPWSDPALGSELLLTGVGPLTGPLEIVVNGVLATEGVEHLLARPGDEIVIGQPEYLRQRFAFFR